jgi:hypothetical protein
MYIFWRRAGNSWETILYGDDAAVATSNYISHDVGFGVPAEFYTYGATLDFNAGFGARIFGMQAYVDPGIK